MSSKRDQIIARIKDKKSASVDGGAAREVALERRVDSVPRQAVGGKKNLWVTPVRENPGARMRMFLFHYAGGARSIYRDWADYLPQEIELCAVQLPGREDRADETPYRDFGPLIKALSGGINQYLIDKPFVFFGHCMGALTSFELVRQLRRDGSPLPVQMFISAFINPAIPKSERESIIFNIPNGMVDDFFVELGGTPQDVLHNIGLMNLTRPVMDADLDLLRGHRYVPEEAIDIPISAFGACQDKLVIVREIEAWQEQTLQDFDLTLYPGNHFYLQTHRSHLMRTLTQKLGQLLKNGAN